MFHGLFFVIFFVCLCNFDAAYFSALLSLEDSSLQFLVPPNPLHDAQLIIDVSGYEQKEFLLIFTKLGIYVDGQGELWRHIKTIK